MPSVNHPQTWRQISDGHWVRPMSAMEPYFYFFGDLTGRLVNGREHYIVYSSIRIKSSTGAKLSEESLEQAWIQLRYDQPGLATTGDPSDWTLHYQVPSEDGIKQWLDSTLKIIKDINLPASELFSHLGPVSQASLYWLPNTSELIFRCPHWKIDGIGTWLFWDALFNALERPRIKLHWGGEVVNLNLTMEHIQNLETRSTPEQAKEATDQFLNWASNVPGISPPSRLGQAPPGKSRKAQFILDENTTTALIAACKKTGVSVTSAVHAAFALANAEHAAHETAGKTKYVSLSSINMRNWLGIPYNTSSQAVNLYYTPLPMVLDVNDYKQMSADIQLYYKNIETDNAKIRQLNPHLLQVLFAVAQTPEFQTGPVPSDALMSSLGIGERYFKIHYRDFEILDIDNALDVVMGMSLIFLYTFRNSLRLTYCYNDGFQDEALIQKILKSTKAILQRELRL